MAGNAVLSARRVLETNLLIDDDRPVVVLPHYQHVGATLVVCVR